MKYVVFLDIDGVFTSNRVHTAHNAYYPMWSRFDPVAIDFMNYIHDTYQDVSFVFISTWVQHLSANDTMIRHWIESAMTNSGFRGKIADIWKTDPDGLLKSNPSNTRRALEIQQYITNHVPDYFHDFIIFDDNDFNFKQILGINRLVKTDPDNGLLHKHMLNAKSIMGNWTKKRYVHE